MVNKFIVIVPVYNAVNYIERCLTSVIEQDYPNREICVMDDHSDDGTWEKINDVNNNFGCQLNICRNEYRIGSSLANVIKAIELFALNKEDIIVKVDGDDCLSGNDVLSHLDSVYQDKDVYMTYGQFIPMSGQYGAYGQQIPDTFLHRKKHQWYASHLITFKKKLFEQIGDSDMRDESGEYYKVLGDAFFVYPMVEMCGLKHSRFINKVTYLYNDLNPQADMKINLQEQLRLSDAVWAMPSYGERGEL